MQFYEVALLLNQKLDIEVAAEGGVIQKVCGVCCRPQRPTAAQLVFVSACGIRDSNQVVLLLNSTNAGSATLMREYATAPFRLQCAISRVRSTEHRCGFDPVTLLVVCAQVRRLRRAEDTAGIHLGRRRRLGGVEGQCFVNA
jgi:hypothetical protein